VVQNLTSNIPNGIHLHKLEGGGGGQMSVSPSFLYSDIFTLIIEG
jgi:hypothetical protein